MKKLIAILCLAAAPAGANETADLFQKKCAGCHGEDGQAQTRMGKKFHAPNFTSAKWQAKAKDEKLKRVIEEGVTEDGVNKMPAWKEKLSPAEINSLVQYVRTFKK